MDRQFGLLYGYLALAKRPGKSGPALEERTRFLVQQLAADRSGCRWCIERARHHWRAQGLSVDLLRELGHHETSDALTERERAALALVDSVACARVAELIACLAEHHLIADDHP